MGLYVKTIRWYLFSLVPCPLKGVVYRVFNFSVASSAKFRKYNVGVGSYVDPDVQIVGWENVTVGRNSVISEGAWINVNFRDNSTERVVIGNNCHIGRRNFFSVGPLIRIKDYGFTGLDCHFLGCGHNIDSPSLPYVASGLSLGGNIEIGVNCWLATAVTVMQNVTIGHGTVVGARSLVVNDLPPFSIAVGVPCRVIKRFDFKRRKWISIDDWDSDFDKYMPNEDEYLKALVDGFNDIRPSFLSGSSRFGWL